MKIEKLNEAPIIEIKFGGAALADEVYNDNKEIRIVINQLIDNQERIQEVLMYLGSLCVSKTDGSKWFINIESKINEILTRP